MSQRLAVIDIGSSAIKYGIYDFSSIPPSLVAEGDPISTSLGRGMKAGDPLPSSARAATLNCARRFVSEIQEWDATLTLVCATEAVRRASDKDDFMAELRQIFGPVPKICCITGEQEVAWGLLSAKATLDLDLHLKRLFIDPGGSSNDIAYGPEGHEKWISLPFGMNDLLAAVGIENNDARLSTTEIGTLRHFLCRRYDDILGLIDGDVVGEIIGTSGAALAIGAVKSKVAINSRTARVRGAHGIMVSQDDLEKMVAEMAPLSAQERRRLHPSLSPTRALIFIHGALIYQVLLEVLEKESFRVNGFGMKLGGLIESRR